MDKNIEKAVVYPFTDSMLPILQYLRFSDMEMTIKFVIEMKRKYLIGKDAGYIKNKPDLGILISDNFEMALDESDILIYTDELVEIISTKIVLRDIERALRIRKKVICLRKLADTEIKNLSDIALKMNVQFYYFGNTNYKIPDKKIEYIPGQLNEPEASVVMVGEMFKGIDGKNICLSLVEDIEAAGYKCVSIMEEKYADVVHAYPFPASIKSNNVSESNKVFYLNNYIKYIDVTVKPDVIIILIPDSMMKYNKMFGNGFGIFPYLLSQSVQTDCFIFCTQFDYVETEFYDRLSTVFENRFGFGIDFIHMSNIMLDVQKSQITGKLSFLCQTQDKLNRTIEEKYQNSKIPVLNCLKKKQSHKLSSCILEKLKSYAEINLVLPLEHIPGKL